MKVAITGGSGFIGLACAEALLARGHQVVLIDLAPPAEDYLAHPALEGAVFEAVDITDARVLKAVFERQRPDQLLHGAAITANAQLTRERAADVVAVNITGSVNVLEQAVAAGVGSLVALSSIATYGTQGPWTGETLDEKQSLQPDSLYGITKASAESLLGYLAPLHGLALTQVRLGPVFGPWELQGELRPDLSPHGQVLALQRRGDAVRLPSAMESDWLYSRDAGAALAQLMELVPEQRAGMTLNLGAGVRSSVREWSALMGLDAVSVDSSNANVLARAPQSRPPLDITRLNQLTGFTGTRALAAACQDHTTWLDTLSAGRI